MKLALPLHGGYQIGEHTALFPGTSFPDSGPNAEFLSEHGAFPVVDSLPHDQATQRLIGIAPAVQDWQVCTVAVENIPAQEIAIRVEASIMAEAQRRLDAFAQAKGYDDIFSLVGYADDPDPIFAAEGQTGRAARSAMWTALRNYKDRVMAGEAPMPQSLDDVPGLPVLTWE